MDFKQELVKKMVERNLSESSIKNYIRNLEILNDDKPLKNLNFLKNKDDILDKIKNKKPNTQRSYLISIVSSLSSLDDSKLKKLYEYYYDKMTEMNETLKSEEKKNIKSETQSKNWIERKEIDEKLNELENKVKSYNKKDITEKQYNEVLKMIVLSLYALQAPRRNADYQYMLIVKNKVPDDKINFLVYDKKEFWFRKYKTFKTEINKIRKDDPNANELKVPINDKLFENINLYLKFHPDIKGKKVSNSKEEIPFLVNYDGEPLLSVNAITYIMNRIFGKNIGSSMFRHFYTSHKYGDVLEEMKEDAKYMSHSLEQQQDYIKK